MEKQKMHYITVRSIRYCLALVLFSIVSAISNSASYFAAKQMFADVSKDAISVIHIILSALAYHSFLRAFITTDAPARSHYFDGDKNKVKFLRTSPDFKISLIATAAFFAIFSDAFAVASLQGWLEIPKWGAYSIAAVVFLAVLILTWVESFADWKKAEERIHKEKRKRKDTHLLIKYCISSCLVYPIMGYLLPIFFPTLRTLPLVLWTIVLGVVPIVAVLVLAFLSLDYIRALYIRFKFFRKLKKAAKINKYKVSKIKYPYSSLFIDHDENSFTVVSHGKTYTCKLLSGIHYGNPMYFEEEGKGVVIHHVSLRYRVLTAAPFARGGHIWQKLPADLMQFHTYFKYDFEGEGKKVLLVCPTPHSIYASEYGQEKLLDVNDKVYGYTLMTGTAFLNALERDCVC